MYNTTKMKKTLEQLATELIATDWKKEGVIKLMQIVRNATAKECSTMANEHGAFYTCDEIDFKIVDTDYIVIDENMKDQRCEVCKNQAKLTAIIGEDNIYICEKCKKKINQ